MVAAVLEHEARAVVDAAPLPVTRAEAALPRFSAATVGMHQCEGCGGFAMPARLDDGLCFFCAGGEGRAT